MYLGYLLLFSAIDREDTRRRACAILGVLIFLDIPIIYKSVSWWRTLHQPPSLMRAEGSTMAMEIKLPLYAACFLVWLLTVLLIVWRKAILEKERRVKIHFISP
jgi:heme exporter protein C